MAGKDNDLGAGVTSEESPGGFFQISSGDAQSGGSAANSAAAAEAAALLAAEEALKSEGFAIGEQDGIEVVSGVYFENNSEYYSEQADADATSAAASAAAAAISAQEAEDAAASIESDYPDVPTPAGEYVLNVIEGADNTWELLPASQDPISAGTGITITSGDTEEISITAGGVDTVSLANGGVTRGKITDSAISTAKLNDASVTVDKLVDSAVTTVKLDDGAVTTAKLGDESVTEVKIDATNTPTDGQLLSVNADGDLTWVTETANGTLAAGTGISIATSGSESTISIPVNGVITTRIANAAVTSTKLGDGAVTTDKLGSSSVDNSKMANDAIQDANLDASNTGTAGQILSADGDGTFTWVDEAAGVTYTASDGITLASDDFSLTDSGVTTAKVNDGAVTTAKLADNSVTTGKIVDGTIVEPDLNITNTGTAGQILTLGDPATGTFTWVSETNSGNIAGGEGITAVVSGDTDTISITDLGVTTAKLAANSVTNPKINDLAVATDKLDNNAVTNAKMADNAIQDDNLDASNSGTAGQILSADGDGTFTWIDADGNTAYTASDGITLASDDFSLTDSGVTTAKLNDSAVTSAKIADNNVTADELNVSGDGTSGQFLSSDGDGSMSWVNGNNTLEGLTDTNIPAGGPSVRSFLEYNTTDDTWDSRAATEFLNVAELFDVDITNLQNNQFLRYNSTDDRWENESVSIPNGLSGSSTVAINSDVLSVVDGSIDTTQLANAGVTSAKLTSDSVTEVKIVNNAVTRDKIASNAVGSTELLDNAVNTSKVGDNQVTTAKLATDIPVSTFSDVNTSGANSGQLLGYNGTTWVAVNSSGGGNSDNSRLVITLNPTSLDEGDADTTVTVVLSIGDPADGETDSLQSVTVTDPLGNNVAVTGSGDSWSFTASTVNPGNFVVRANATFTIGSDSSVHSTSANLRVQAAETDWYYATLTSSPTAIAGMTNGGEYSQGVTTTFTADGDGLHRFYIALPTRSGGYKFFGTPNRFVEYTSTPEVAGFTTSGYTLYAIDDIDDTDSGTAPVYVEE